MSFLSDNKLDASGTFVYSSEFRDEPIRVVMNIPPIGRVIQECFQVLGRIL